MVSTISTVFCLYILQYQQFKQLALIEAYRLIIEAPMESALKFLYFLTGGEILIKNPHAVLKKMPQ